jgi:SAM-dependent methyltransferase
MGEWEGYILEDYDYVLRSRSVVIDIGCGEGRQLADFVAQGHSAAGLDLKPSCILPGVQSRVVQARAEALPFRSGCADAVVIKVVLPYTDARKTLAEMSRVLKPGGRCILVGHGTGYSLRYLLRPPEWRLAFYGFRTLVNSALYFATGMRLPGFLGDTIVQTRGRLKQLYRRSGLALIAETPSRGFLGFPVFLYHEVRKMS